MLKRTIRIDLEQFSEVLELPFDALLKICLEQAFDPLRCYAIFRQVFDQHPILDRYFDCREIKLGGVLARSSCLFPKPSCWQASFHQCIGVHGSEESYSTSVLENSVSDWASVFRQLISHADSPSLMESLADLGGPAFLFWQRELEETRAWPRAEVPGIYRREHASLVFCSKATKLVLDPICFSGDSLPGIPQSPLCHDDVDAILVSHGHVDHWHLPSVLATARKDSVPVIVPEVSHSNLLSPFDFGQVLTAASQHVVVPKWGETLKIGEFEIEILPFYGEQPSSVYGSPKGVRNYGNCFRITCDEFSALVLIDSGKDADGSMIDVVEESCKKRGPVDIVLSCMRSFPCPFMGGLSPYWTTLPFGILREMFWEWHAGRLPTVGLSSTDLVNVCRAAKSRWVAPYAHGFAGAGVPISDVGWGLGEPSESIICQTLACELEAKRCEAQVIHWNPGDIIAARQRSFFSIHVPANYDSLAVM